MNDWVTHGEMVPFTEIAVVAYLNTAIVFWRKKRDDAPDTPEGEKLRLMASHYIDAYQSVRVSLFGDRLPVEEGTDRRLG